MWFTDNLYWVKLFGPILTLSLVVSTVRRSPPSASFRTSNASVDVLSMIWFPSTVNPLNETLSVVEIPWSDEPRYPHWVLFMVTLLIFSNWSTSAGVNADKPIVVFRLSKFVPSVAISLPSTVPVTLIFPVIFTLSLMVSTANTSPPSASFLTSNASIDVLSMTWLPFNVIPPFKVSTANTSPPSASFLISKASIDVLSIIWLPFNVIPPLKVSTLNTSPPSASFRTSRAVVDVASITLGFSALTNWLLPSITR